ncbi:MAG TPA: ATP-binding protein [Ktedonobacterales bacterium]|nr:ATP-binding protein [Ktedonobacterales bacterium]
MERMNEILARAASRRISTRRAPTPAPSALSAAKAASAGASAPSAPSSSPRHSAPRRVIMGQASSKSAATIPPRRPAADADASQPTPPAADVLDSDRILELPARPATGIIRSGSTGSTGSAGSAGARPREMTSLREIAPTYAAQLGPRRAGSGASSASSAPNMSSAANPASQPSAPSASNKPSGRAQSGRATRASGKASAPGVCPLCHGAGYVRLDVPVGDPAFGQAIRCQCKEQQLKERDRLNLRNVSNLDPFHDKTFEAFDSALPGLREAHDIARHYAEDPLGWLVLRGGYGCGKTHLAAAIAHVAQQRDVAVIFAIVPDLLDHLRATFAPSSDMPYDALFDKVRESELLVLDDFGAENSTAWATEKLFQLINYRYNYRMPTVITTNHRLLAHMDERIRSRLSDLGLVRHVVIEAADYRERHTGRPSRGGSRSRSREGYSR